MESVSRPSMKPAVFALLMLACWTTTSALLPVQQQLQRRLHALQSSNGALRDAARTKLSRGDFAGAIADFEACGPEDAAARIGLGVATLSTGDHAGSLAHFRAAARSTSRRRRRTTTSARCGGAPAEAIAPLKRAVELEPDDAEFLGALGKPTRPTARTATRSPRSTAVAAADEPSLFYNRANSLADLGRTEAAVEATARPSPAAATTRRRACTSEWRSTASSAGARPRRTWRSPGTTSSRSACSAASARASATAATTAAATRPRTPRALLFDGYAQGRKRVIQRRFNVSYADDFDADLVGKLVYRGPAALVDEIRGDARGWASVLDVGAGTGLLAKELSGSLAPGCRVHANDVSRKMLDRAPPGLYSSVAVGDAVDVLEAWPDGDLDAVLAADVVGYIRDVGPLLAAARRALDRGGILAFTVEVSHDDGATGAVGALGPAAATATTSAARVDAAAAGFRREPAFADLREDAGARVRGAVLVFVRR
ncbi:hypothetical protein JL720_16548 [Aureococcus anophagefferens]|nr:hypothetical protein JL720_16548 [Aureococcus anophagefferens]